MRWMMTMMLAMTPSTSAFSTVSMNAAHVKDAIVLMMAHPLYAVPAPSMNPIIHPSVA